MLFSVMIGEDIVKSDLTALKQLMEQYEKLGSGFNNVREVDEDNINRYGVMNHYF